MKRLNYNHTRLACYFFYIAAAAAFNELYSSFPTPTLYPILSAFKADILIFSPNDVFSEYISDVLPSLGESNTLQTTFADYLSFFLNEYKDVELQNLEPDFILRFSSNYTGYRIYIHYNFYVDESFESIDLELSKIYLSCFVSFSKIPRLYVLPSKVLIVVLLSMTIIPASAATAPVSVGAHLAVGAFQPPPLPFA